MIQRDRADAGDVIAPFASSHKFIPPLPLAEALPRSRLTSGILGRNPYAAVVIQGPAGHGKTTLMQQVLQASLDQGVVAGWLSLDESDNDISRLLACLTTLVRSVIGIGSDAGRTAPGRSKSTGTAENILHSLAGTDRLVALFLDEFQMINNPVIIGLLDSLLERVPPNVTFYFGTRSIPELARGRLMISGRVKWITPDELCFTRREVHDFLQHVGLAASASDAAAFQERTGGWPAVLQLLQLALKSGNLSRDTLLAWAAGCESELRDYLADNVMSLQTGERHRFLLRTSILRRLTAPLCEQLSGTRNAQQVLRDLVAQGMFLRSIDVEHRWFRYHSIFSDYLKAQLARTEPGAIAGLHLKAADWFREHGNHEEAIYHAIEAGQTRLAARVLDDWMPELIRTARLHTAERFVAMLPRPVLEQFPRLLWGRTWALMFLRQPERAQQSLQEFERQLKRHPAADLTTSLQILKCAEALATDQPYAALPWVESLAIDTASTDKERCFEMGGLANVKAICRLQQHRFPEAREFALLGESMGTRGEAAFSRAYSTSLFAYALILDGHLDQALARLRYVLDEEYLNVQESFASASLSAVYGFALYESGNFADAESQLRDSMDMIAQTVPVDWLISAFISLARASALSEGDGRDSQDILDDGERLGLVSRAPRLVRAMRREKIRLAIGRRNCAEARDLLRLLDQFGAPELPAGWEQFSEGSDDDFVCRTRLGIYCADPLSVLAPLAEQIALARDQGHVRRTIKLLILHSLAHAVLGRAEASTQLMLEAVELAAPAGYVSSFIEEGSDCLDTLAAMLEGWSTADTALQRAFVERVLSLAGIEQPVTGDEQTPSGLIEPLTRKETKILGLVLNGSTNAELADQLFVSKNTIKFHLKNIYAKLGVTNRVQAIGTARRMRLI